MPVTAATVKKILKNSLSKHIVVLGDLMLDIYLRGSATRLSQEAPVPIVQIKNKKACLGGASNVMRNLSALSGCSISAFGAIGDDDSGRLLRGLLKEGRIDTSNVLIDKTRRTTEKQRVLAGNQQVVRMDFEDTRPVPDSIRNKLVDSLKSKIRKKQVDAIIFEDYAKGLLEKDMLQEVVDLAVKYGVYTSLDPHPGHPMEVRSLSLMTPNRLEAFGLAGVYHFDAAPVVEKDKNLIAVAEKIIDSWSPESLLITLGHQGMALFEKKSPDKMFVIPTIAREVFDVSGAGDTVIATYTLCMTAGAKSCDAAVISNHAAGIVVGKIGTAVPSVQELLDSFKVNK